MKTILKQIRDVERVEMVEEDEEKSSKERSSSKKTIEETIWMLLNN